MRRDLGTMLILISLAATPPAWAEEEAFREFWLQPQENEELLPLHYLGGSRFCLMGEVINLAKPPE